MERFKLVSAVHLILIQDGKVLLLRRFQTGYEDGNYSVPAGHLDGNEPVTKAMAREALEEACIHIAPADLRVVHTMHRTKEDGERIDFFLTADTWQGEIKIGEPHKCDDLSWFPLDNLPENTISYIRSALDHIALWQNFSEFGW
jgi:ADP-ribose pyrophosphatase YjhB (NUDIX family)